MSTADMLVVISYDVTDNRRRRRLSKCLEHTLTRVQKSVFEGRLNAKDTKRLTQEAEQIIGPGDNLRVYSIGADGMRRSEVLGASAPLQEDSAFWLV